MELYKKLFNFKFKNNMELSISNNEIYIQSLLFLFDEYKNGDLIIVTPTLSEATKLFNKIRTYIDNCFLFPEDEYITKKALATSPEFLYMRLDLLNNIKLSGRKIVICHLNSFIKKLPDPIKFDNKKINLKINDIYSRDGLINKLNELGFKRETIVSNTGEFSIRGYVVDVFPLNEKHPIRIEFFDDVIESIKIFDEFSQLTIRKIDKLSISPIKEEVSTIDSNIIDYLNNPLVIRQNINTIMNVYDSLLDQMKYYNDEDSDYNLLENIKIDNKLDVDLLNNTGSFDYIIFAFETKNYNDNINEFIKDITVLSSNHIINIYSKNKNIKKKILDSISSENINFYDEELNNGFIYNNEYYYTTSDLYSNSSKVKYKTNYKLGTKVNDIEKLNIGDYVVHRVNGIGIYQGIKTLEKNGIKKDYIFIQYKGEDKLYLPVEDVDKLYKYTSKEGVQPKIYRLASNEWKKQKAKIISRVNEIREELVNLYKEREKIKVVPFLKDNEEQEIFEHEFEYEDTPDQVKAVKEIKADLESNKPMDRLLCGDVGYGKTEVIFRAIFKTVMNGKQVAYLCPTTILSFQQFNSAKDRFKNYAINIELLNRHTSLKEVKRIIADLKNGKIDVLFGTHRLLSGDVDYKDLGLLVIDEEHRFGVKHKEKIKELKNNVHVLSVSATPIPRTLQMSLVGIRDLSLIETAPNNRLPVQTYVINYDEMLIKEVVNKEISRNGQVFILYNNILDMERLQEKYSKMLPDARIRYAHGQMDKEDIQNVMIDFLNHNFDVLIATTIIENGVDIPNANTIIVIDADKFGLSQLYQIRGRVGRSDRMAYAYLMYDDRKILTDTAIKRLDAIKEFTELGSGYKISMRDLTIRGAGDILGKEQAGFIDSVGVDMYLDLINGIDDEDESKHIIIDEVSTHIDEKYTDEDEIIIEIHKRITAIKSLSELKETIEILEDRFGYVGDDLKLYMYQELLESMLENENVNIFSNDKIKIKIELNNDLINKINVEELFIFTTKLNNKFSFEYKNNFLYITLNKINLEEPYQILLIRLLTYIVDNKKEDN